MARVSGAIVARLASKQCPIRPSHDSLELLVEISYLTYSIYKIRAYPWDMAAFEYRQTVLGAYYRRLLRCSLLQLGVTGREIEFALVIFRECRIPCGLSTTLLIESHDGMSQHKRI